MSTKSAIVLLLLSSVFFACQPNPQSEVPFRGYVTIPAGINTFMTHHFPITNIPGIPFDNVISAQPAYVRLYVEDGEFSADFIREAFFDATTDSTRREMAWRQDIPLTNSRNLELIPSTLEMKDHVSQDNFEMTLKLNLRAIPVTTTRIRVEFGVLATYGE